MRIKFEFQQGYIEIKCQDIRVIEEMDSTCSYLSTIFFFCF
uniref:Uncharacterized protein n=1 Tax=Arundo donax TaxID=35708 RepID=A0A0A8ZND6_ARUDO